MNAPHNLNRALLELESGFGSPQQVREHVRVHGFVHVCPMPESRFLQLAEGLGHVVARTDVRVENGRSLITSAAAIPFHTDGPEAEVIGWWCAEPDESNGESLLIDAIDLPIRLDRTALEELPRTHLYLPASGGMGTTHPCLSYRDGRHRIYYAPWNLLPLYTPEQHNAICALRDYLRSQRPWVVPLRQGESLFIDNERVLHGRAAISANSRRHLRRVWISLRADTGFVGTLS